MFSKFRTRREFLNCSKLSLLFLLNSCSNLPNKGKIALQNSFYPQSFKDSIPKGWKQVKINFGNMQPQKNRNTILNSDFTLINDGWINSKTNGKMRLEGKDYIVKDGDILNFRFNT